MPKKKKQTKALTKRQMKKGIEMWGNIFTTDKDLAAVTREYCHKVAEVYEVPPSGVISMGNQPYLNKDARLFLLNGFINEKKIPAIKESKIHPLQVSLTPEQSAIYKAIIVLEDGRYFDAIGEASRASVKLEAVKNTLNMMAETRALNRVIWKIVAGHTMERVVKNLKNSSFDEDTKEKIVEAGRTSAEEVAQGETKKKQGEDAFKLAKNTLSKNVNSMEEEDKDAVAKKIESSKIYTKPQKDELYKIIYQG